MAQLISCRLNTIMAASIFLILSSVLEDIILCPKYENTNTNISVRCSSSSLYEDPGIECHNETYNLVMSACLFPPG
jgi:hypothetical protein